MAEQSTSAHTPTAARGPLTPAVLTNPAAMTDDHPRVLVRLRDMRHGLEILSRLAIGDESALAEVGVKTQGPYNTQVHEWALGRHRVETGACFLIAGGPHKVSWGSATLADLDSIGHTHPWQEIDRAAATADLGPTVIEALTRWLSKNPKTPIPLMSGGFSYIFPSNQDVIAAFYGDRTRPEVAYSPYRLGSDGWLSRTRGGTVFAKYGPVTATLVPHAVRVVKTNGEDIRTAAGMKRTEEGCLAHLWCPVEFFAGNDALLNAFLHIDPAGASGKAVMEFAWFHADAPPSAAMSRGQLQQFIRDTRG